MIDENTFFREGTLCLCRSLEIEKSLESCLHFLKGHMPGCALALQLFERSLGAMRVVAVADEDGARLLNVLIPLPETGKQHVRTEKTVLHEAVIINRPSADPIGAVLLPAGGRDPDNTSVIVMPVLSELEMNAGQTYGAVVLVADGTDQYTPEHVRYLSLLVEPFAIALSNALKHQELQRLERLLKDENQFLQRELSHGAGTDIIGADFGLAETMNSVRRVAGHDSPVMLLGETGVGKDVIANHIHQLSPRRKGPLIKVNCGAIPESLIDSELFGHEKGAFTGAVAMKRGRFERAHEGTIFLDEVGELPPQVQVRLLRVLQNKEIERVGGTELIPVDIRVIAATNRDLNKMVNEKSFREDLWFRLNVFPVHIPPLRERRGDIPALLEHAINRKAKELKLHTRPSVPEGMVDQLLDYAWPGNVRELENVVERALILNSGKTLPLDEVLGQRPVSAPRAKKVDADVPARTLDEVVSDHIETTLLNAKGKIHGKGGAAERLGMNESTLRNRMKKLKIDYLKQPR